MLTVIGSPLSFECVFPRYRGGYLDRLTWLCNLHRPNYPSYIYTYCRRVIEVSGTYSCTTYLHTVVVLINVECK